MRLARIVSLFVLVATAAYAQVIDEFPTLTDLCFPASIVGGPDGNLWYTNGLGLVGRATPSGSMTEFTVQIGSDPHGITVGVDGNLWFAITNSGRIGRITPDGVITQFTTPSPNSQPIGVATGSDGNVWFTERGANRVGRITPTGSIAEFDVPFPLYDPTWIAAGSDGNLWFTLNELRVPNSVARITPTGTITNFQVASGGYLGQITQGSDRNLWFVEIAARKIGRITASGVVSDFQLPPLAGPPYALCAGPDGHLWVGSTSGFVVISTAGNIVRQVSIPANTNGPSGATAGPDGNIWFTLPFAGDIAKGGPLRSELCRIGLVASGPAIPAQSSVGLAFLVLAIAVSGGLVLTALAAAAEARR